MRSAAVVLLYLTALAGGTYSAFRPTFDSRFARIQADPGDGMLNHYLLEHTWRAVSDPVYCGSLLSPPMFYPQKLTLAYSETFLGVAPLYWGLRLGLPDTLAFQWWAILCAALNFAAFAVVARRLGCNHLLAALGGFLWAFGLCLVVHHKHQQIIPRFWMPPAVYYAWLLATVPSLRALNRTIAFAFLQVTACVYTGWFLSVGLLVFVPAAAAAARSGGLRDLLRFLWQNRGGVGRVIGIWVLAFAAYFAPYAVANFGYGRTYVESLEMLPTLAGWLTGPPGSRWHDTLKPLIHPVSEECILFSGFGLYLLMAVAGAHVWLTRRDQGRPRELALVAGCLVTVAVWGLLTLNIANGVSGWWIARFLPGGAAIRAVSRVYCIVYLFGTFAAVVWLQVVTARIRRPWVRAVVLVGVAGPVAFEQTGFEPDSYAKADFYPLVDRCAANLRGADAGYVEPTIGTLWLHGDVVGMWAGLRANVPVVNG
jgi:hypothetical protein